MMKSYTEALATIELSVNITNTYWKAFWIRALALRGLNREYDAYEALQTCSHETLVPSDKDKAVKDEIKKLTSEFPYLLDEVEKSDTAVNAAEENKEVLLSEVISLKEQGNACFLANDYNGALLKYTAAIKLLQSNQQSDSVM